jgi:hypothetical protein
MGLYFHSIITWAAVFFSIMISIDHNGKGTRQGNIKHAPKTRPHCPTFHDKCNLYFFFFFFYSGTFSIAYRQLHKPGSIWADVTPDLLVGAWYKVWLCRGPNNGSLCHLVHGGNLQGPPQKVRVQVCRGEPECVCPMFELLPCVHYSASRVTRADLSSHCSWSLVVSWEVESCRGRVQAFQRMILDGEAGSGKHSHSGEAGFTQLWWIQRAFFATLTVVGIDKITTKGPL